MQDVRCTAARHVLPNGTHYKPRLKEETAQDERSEQEAEMAKLRKERREAERRWADKVKIHNHRKMKAAAERRRAEELESEVAAMAGRKREKALQDYIRVNMRKVTRISFTPTPSDGPAC